MIKMSVGGNLMWPASINDKVDSVKKVSNEAVILIMANTVVSMQKEMFFNTLVAHSQFCSAL